MSRTPRSRRLKIAAALLLLLPICLLLVIASRRGSQQPNLLIISVDTLRADHVGCYGYQRDTTPNIDKMAGEGIRFTNCTAASSWTAPSHMSIFTSLYPTLHGVVNTKTRVGDGTPMLAELLKENGYKTAAFVSARSIGSKYGFDRGFDLYDDFTILMKYGFSSGSQRRRKGKALGDAVTSQEVYKLAGKWLDNNYRNKFFLFAHFFDPHHSYVPPPPYDTMFDADYKGKVDGRGIKPRRNRGIKPPKSAMFAGMPDEDYNHFLALYDGEIRHTDEYVGMLLGELERLGVMDNTLVVFVSDHGDEFLDHGGVAHSHTLYQELVHVPLLMKLPSRIPKGATSDALVSHVDIMPTILDLLHIAAPETMHGISLLPLMEGGTFPQDRAIFSEVSHRRAGLLKAVRRKDYKFLYEYEKSVAQLFDLKSDPPELNNLAASWNGADITEKEGGSAKKLIRRAAARVTEGSWLTVSDTHSAPEAAALGAELMQWAKNSLETAESVPGSDRPRKIVLDRDTKEFLRALGYMQ